MFVFFMGDIVNEKKQISGGQLKVVPKRADFGKVWDRGPEGLVEILNSIGFDINLKDSQKTISYVVHGDFFEDSGFELSRIEMPFDYNHGPEVDSYYFKNQDASAGVSIVPNRNAFGKICNISFFIDASSEKEVKDISEKLAPVLAEYIAR